MSKINQMTMAEILAEAIRMGFDPKPWKHCWFSWNDGVEVAACKFLEAHVSDLDEKYPCEEE